MQERIKEEESRHKGKSRKKEKDHEVKKQQINKSNGKEGKNARNKKGVVENTKRLK